MVTIKFFLRTYKYTSHTYPTLLEMKENDHEDKLIKQFVVRYPKDFEAPHVNDEIFFNNEEYLEPLDKYKVTHVYHVYTNGDKEIPDLTLEIVLELVN